MAKNITLMGADYPDGPAVQLPKTGGGTATFYDIQVIDNLNSDSSTDALSAKQGKELKSKIAYDWNSFNNYVSPLETGASGIIMRFGKMRAITFQGLSRTHTEDEVLATLPEADRPTAGGIFASGNVGSSSVVVRINTNGQITLYSLNGVTASGRIYFNAAYAVG